MKRLPTAILLTCCGCLAALFASAQTDGVVNFNVRTVSTGANYHPNHILAVWITNGADEFVKTLKKQAASREQYLYQWISDSSRNDVDAITGATLSAHQTHQLEWNCTDINGVTVPDGSYYVHVEFSERNGQGPWTANTVQFSKGTTPGSVTPADQTNFKDMSLVYEPDIYSTLVAPGAVWNYHDGGVDLHGTNWTASSYDDSGWTNGQTRLGYGGDGETSPILSYGSNSSLKHPCYYFRHAFTASYVPAGLLVRVARDDGVVVYLNGVEIARDNMGTEPVTYSQYAVAAIGGSAETAWLEFVVDPALISVGRNVLAAEVHQADPTSSDMGFNLELSAWGDPPTVPPIVITDFSQTNMQWVMTGYPDGCYIEAKSELTSTQAWERLDYVYSGGPTTDVALAGGSYTTRFFRVVSGGTLPYGLTAYYPLDGSAEDMSVHQNDGTINGAVSTTNRFAEADHAYSFNGTGVNITAPDINALDVTHLTMAFWFQPAVLNPYNNMVNKLGKEGHISFGSHIGSPDSTDKVCFRICTGGTLATLTDLYTTNTVGIAEWHHFCGTYDGTEMKLYLDGVPNNSTPKTGAIFKSNTPLQIGTYSFYGGWYFNGALDEVALWDRALDSNEVWQVFQSTHLE